MNEQLGKYQNNGGIHMQITDVRVRKVTKEGKMKAVVSITIDDEFVVHDIKVIEGEKGSFVAMPTKTTEGKDGKTEYSEVCYPVTKEFREQLYGEIIKKSNAVKEQKKEIGGFKPIRDFGDEKLPFR